jgi:hypothetical protein
VVLVRLKLPPAVLATLVTVASDAALSVDDLVARALVGWLCT